MHASGIDPAPINHYLRALNQTRVLVAAVCHLKVFEALAAGPLPLERLREALGLRERPAMVLLPALRSMGLLGRDASGNFHVTELGCYLTSRADPNLIGYLGLTEQDPGVLQMADYLRNDGPLDAPDGINFVKETDKPSPMDHPELARTLTLALSGRARHIAPVVAQRLPHRSCRLLDVAGGTGYYAYEWLRVNPRGTATVFDRPEVLKVARECLEGFSRSGREGADTVVSRVRFTPGDMLSDPLPKADLLLAFSLFHDWPAETCRDLAHRFAQALEPGGEIWIHDAFLNDDLDGPQAAADYSAQLFMITKGRCYSRREHFDWLEAEGLRPGAPSPDTLMDYGLISAVKPGA